MTVKDIYNYLDRLYPVNTALSFDNPGILVGNPDKSVTNVMLALDCTNQVVKDAKAHGCELIITHHPVIFNPIKSVISDDIVYNLIKNDISVISMHTNLDIGKNGVNDCLCKKLSISNIAKIPTNDGFLLNYGELSEYYSCDDLALFIKSRLNAYVKYLSSDRKIKKVIVCSGSGGEYLDYVTLNNCDALITSEVKHHVFLRAQHLGISVFDAGHFNTEDVVIEPLKEQLNSEFPMLNLICNHSTKIKSV